MILGCDNRRVGRNSLTHKLMQDRIDFLENDRSFKEPIGAFVIAFSKVEYALALLSSLTEKDIRKANEVFVDSVGQPLEIKLRRIMECIKSELPELKAIWEKRVKCVNR